MSPRDTDRQALRRAADELRNRIRLSDLIGRRTTVKRTGSRYAKALCLFHSEKSASLTIHDDKGFYHCFGCGAHGDAIDFVMATEGLGFVEAMRWLGAAELPVVSEADRIRAAAEDDAEREAAIAEAQGIWDAAAPAAGTPAEVYVASC